MSRKYDLIFFVDMDGVIAKYDRYAYDRPNGPIRGTALFEHEPSHYFLHCKPDPTGIAMLEGLMLIKDAKTYVLTSVAPHIPWAIEDKMSWLEHNCPCVDIKRQFIATRSDKTEVARAMTLAKTLSETTILIDDFNPNLLKWRNAGGKAVKYLNGVNSPTSWSGLTIDGRPETSNIAIADIITA